jgi:cytochrome c oxidase cbb3-type subunit 3
MSSRCRRPERRLLGCAVACATLVVAAGCDRETREYRGRPLPESTADSITLTDLYAGSPNPPPPDLARRQEYERNAYHLSEGKRLYSAFNCVGCHAHGGGGMGPPLMDADWRYGSDLEQIHATIVQGRPNGMPSFRGKIPDQQVWQIAAYVRSMSGNVPRNAAPSRDDHMQGTPAENRTPRRTPEPTDTPGPRQGITR